MCIPVASRRIGNNTLMDLVKMTLVGRVQPRDPEARFTADGKQVTAFRMVCSRVRNGRDGERIEEADWFQVSTFGRLAENVGNLVKKGSRVLVEGRFTSRVWTDNEGKERTSLEIMANDVLVLDQRQAEKPWDPTELDESLTRPDTEAERDMDALPF